MDKGGDSERFILHIREIVCNNIYGGKVDNKFDLKILDSLVNKYMDERCFSAPDSTELVDGIVRGFNSTGYHDYVKWAKELNKEESPLWAGLPISAEDVLKKQNLEELMAKLLTI